MMRLYASGKVTESLWDSQWQEWQDRRASIRHSSDGLETQQQIHIENLDAALKIIAQVGIVYNRLDCSDQKELLRHMVERVIVDPAGNTRLELRAPFAYLRDISDEVRGAGKSSGKGKKAKTARISSGLGSGNCSDNFLSCGENRIRTCDTGLPLYNRLAGGPIRPLWHLPS